jgi:hypothetical protein
MRFSEIPGGHGRQVSKNGYIRAVIRNTLADSVWDPRTKGHTKTIVDGPV